MKSHSQSHDLRGRPAPLLPARLRLRAVQSWLITYLDSRLANHVSRFAHLSSLATQHCHFLIASRPVLEIQLTRSQQKRKHFLIASFFAVLRPRHLARDKIRAALKAAPTTCDRANAVTRGDVALVFRRGLFLGFGCCFGFGGPGRNDAVHAGVGDGLAEMFVRVRDEDVDHVAVVGIGAELG
jgi:hypothetical protein